MDVGVGVYTACDDRLSTMVKAIPFKVEGWHAPAGRPTREPRPLVQVGQTRPAAPVGAGNNPGPGRQIDQQGGSTRRQPFRRSDRTQDSRPYALKLSASGMGPKHPFILPAGYRASRAS